MSSPFPDADTLAAWDHAHVWHPFTQQDEWEAEGAPLIIDRAEGCELVDIQGRRYLDGIASLWTNVHGHRHPTLDAAVKRQLDRVAHSTMLGQASTKSILLAKRLVDLVERELGAASGPVLSRVFYSDSGSTSVEVALKVAYQYQQQIGQTRRTRIAALSEAYHGDTIGSVSVGGIDLFHGIYRPLLFDAVRLPAPDRADPAEEALCLQRIEALFAEQGDTLAAVVVEPLVQGAAGMRMHSVHYLQRIATLARAHGALLIADEVATGFGRTGTLFACSQAGVRPDILCVAKGLTGGYAPLAATLVSEKIFDGFRGPYTAHRTFFHGHTYTGNPLACAAALANLDVFEQEQVMAGLGPKIAALTETLAALPERWILERRQRGLMAAAVLRHDHGPEARVGHRVCMAIRKHGAILRPLGDTIVFMPALAMAPAQIITLGEAAGRAIQDVLGTPFFPEAP